MTCFSPTDYVYTAKGWHSFDGVASPVTKFVMRHTATENQYTKREEDTAPRSAAHTSDRLGLCRPVPQPSRALATVHEAITPSFTFFSPASYMSKYVHKDLSPFYAITNGSLRYMLFIFLPPHYLGRILARTELTPLMTGLNSITPVTHQVFSPC